MSEIVPYKYKVEAISDVELAMHYEAFVKMDDPKKLHAWGAMLLKRMNAQYLYCPMVEVTLGDPELDINSDHRAEQNSK